MHVHSRIHTRGRARVIFRLALEKVTGAADLAAWSLSTSAGATLRFDASNDAIRLQSGTATATAGASSTSYATLEVVSAEQAAR